MKAKKIIAIGLVAAMTLGMSTSVFATTYDDYPQFNEWGTAYGPTDNVFHAKGQGWLESGKGVNESVTNVIVPVMPNVNIRYAQPGLFDFGFDPQRLVERTGAKKYAGKENFTDKALESGVYFINEPKVLTEGHEKENTYDNKSVKLKGTNIGTKDVDFTVTATLAGGENFKYLTADPSAVVAKTAYQVYEDLYNDTTNNIGVTWEAFVTTHGWDGESVVETDSSDADPFYSNPTMFELAKDLADTDLHYELDNVGFESDQMEIINSAFASSFVKGSNSISLLALIKTVASEATDSTAFMNEMSEYVEADPSGDSTSEDSSDVGMYLELNVNTGDEDTADAAYEDGAVETVFDSANVEKIKTSGDKKIDVAAVYTETVPGTPGNYAMDYVNGEYKMTVRPTADKKFKTVAFWFRGVATNNEMQVLPEGLEVPSLDFTWTFSQIKEKVDPKVVAVGEKTYGEDEAFDGVFDASLYNANPDGVIVSFDMGDYSRITKVELKREDGRFKEYNEGNRPIFFNIDANNLKIRKSIFSDTVNEVTEKQWKVWFVDDLGKETSMLFKFVPSLD